MKVEIMELNSGFANVPNNFILADNYTSYLSSRSNSGGDVLHKVEIPDAEVEKIDGEYVLFIGNKVCTGIFKTAKWWTFSVYGDKDVLVKV